MNDFCSRAKHAWTKWDKRYNLYFLFNTFNTPSFHYFTKEKRTGAKICDHYWGYAGQLLANILYMSLITVPQRSLQMVTQFLSHFLSDKWHSISGVPILFFVKQGVSFKGLYNVLSTQPVLNKVRNIKFVIMKIKQTLYIFFNCGRISSVVRALDCRAGGCWLHSWGCTNTHGLKITEKWRSSSHLHCKWLNLCLAWMAM